MKLRTEPAIGWSTTVICSSRGNPGRGCGAKLVVTAKDVYWGPLHGRDDANAGASFVECPRCGAWTDLHDFAVPPSIAVAARGRGLPGQQPDDEAMQRRAA